MALEAATFVDELVTTNPVAGDNVSQGDDHLRLLKSVLKSTFPSLTTVRYLEQARVDLASSTTPDLSTPASNYINITGTTQIDGFATEPAGMQRLLRFNGVLTLNYNATSMILPSSDDIITAAGDHAIAQSLGSGNWQIVMYHRNAGTALVAQTVSEATEGAAGTVEQATSAEIYAATAGAKALMAQDLETAAAAVALTDAATIALDWDAGINRSLTVAGNRAIGAPTNGQVGTTRNIVVQGDGASARTLTFNAVFQGEVPTLTDITSTRWYELYIRCHVADTHYSVSAKRIKG